MTGEAIDRFVELATRPADDPELARALCDAADALARIPTDALAPHLPRIVLALASRLRVTGGDPALDRAGEVLARVEPRALAASIERALGDDPVDRARRLRELDGIAIACHALLPALDALAPRVASELEDPEAARFAPYVDALLAALAEQSALGSLGAYKAAVRARLRSPRALDPYVALDWAALSLLTSDERNATSRVASAHAPAPNVEIADFDVRAYKRVVEVVRDPATEIDREALRELDPYYDADEVELGQEVGVLDRELTRALRTAALRAFGL